MQLLPDYSLGKMENFVVFIDFNKQALKALVIIQHFNPF